MVKGAVLLHQNDNMLSIQKEVSDSGSIAIARSIEPIKLPRRAANRKCDHALNKVSTCRQDLGFLTSEFVAALSVLFTDL